ncbi:MAG TPA: AmmeMemoRadiSam system protein A [Vicinamibacterales bacterium]|nr:AmmeMemoRadiSam system protein A [Vicinamibacterales bacterium]
MLTETQKAALLRTARESIAGHLTGGVCVVSPCESVPGVSGVFVTIKRGGELRGCLGVLQLSGTLAEEVARCARDSATRDPRFPPMQAEELGEASLEISILGPLETIDPLAEAAIVIGRHGLVVAHGRCRGLLLPQVAVEWRWTREQFLGQTCRKAGLPEDAWRNGAEVFRFDAWVFGESGR